MKKRKYLLLIFLIILIIVLIFHKQIGTHIKIILFITEEFPQIPIKPLGLITQKPQHNKIELQSINGRIVGDLFIPKGSSKESAVILAMGVKTQEKDKSIVLHFAQTMARLGYVVFWPRLDSLDRGISLPEEPETFIEAFKYLEGNPSTHSINTQGRTEWNRSTTSLRVDKSRITFVGFSVGSSTAFVAISDPKIQDKVHSLVFFGGYFDVFDYLLALATKTITDDGSVIPWEPDKDALNHAKSLLEAKGAKEVLKIFEATSSSQAAQILKDAPEGEINGLKRFSPNQNLDQFKAKIFILHEKSDSLVPYVESVKLNQALLQKKDKVFLLVNLFEHVQPNRPINLGELVKLYGFLYKVFSQL